MFPLLLACVLAVGLSAVQVLPDAAALHDAWRQRLSFHIVNRFYLPLDQMGNWIAPTLHGHPANGTFTGRGNFWETCCYVGVVPFLLALVGAWMGRHSRETRFWMGTFVAGVWLATGGAGGLYYLAYWVLPGVRSFHDPARCLVLAALALSVLASRGLDGMRVRLPQRHIQWAVCAALVALAFADVAYFDRQMYPLAPIAALNPVSPNVETVLSDPDVQSGQARVLAPDTARVWQRFTGHRSYRGDAPSYQLLWADTLTPNLPFAYGLRDAGGYEPVARRDATTFAGTATEMLRGADPNGVWAGLLAVKYIALCRVNVPAGGSLRVLRAAPTLAALGKQSDPARTMLCVNNQYQPRARLTTNYVTCPTPSQMWALLSRAAVHPDAVDLRTTTIVVGTVPFVSQRGNAPGTVQITQDWPDTVTLSVVNNHPCLLVLGDTLAPGWTARLDGQAVAILSAEGMVRAVALPRAGRHAVTFTYRPEPFRVGLYVSLFTVLCLSAWGAAQVVKKTTQK